MASDKVKVAVRVRPFNRRETELGTQCVVEIDNHQTILHHPSSTKGESRKPPKTFAFDSCFWSFDESHPHYASQEKVYECLGSDILDNAFQGYNACIFAYGQTGSGKSYTMMGSEDNKGLIPRLCDSLFERIASNTDPNTNYKVEVSYMEIYNEKVHDLLDPKGTKQNLRVREHNILGPYVDGLSTLAVSSYEEIDNLMTEGNKSRTVAATNMNCESSRSHAVFNITLTCSLHDSTAGVTGEKVSKMSLVDLAGSERAVKTGAVGERLKEGSNINKSLTTLGLVISKLADQSSGKTKDKFVPYRDSVLTWLLKDNLGGNSRTVMVATISPAADNYEETLSTLRYADRAKRIVNHAVVNEDPNARIIRELRKEVEFLRGQLINATQQEDLRERLVESEKLMKEMSETWEQKLLRTEKIHQERQQALEKMGISVQASGIKVENDKYYLVNLNADPSLNELLVYYLKERTLIGRPDAPVEQDIQLSGLGIMPEHCIITIENSEIFITPLENSRSCVNGSVITCKTQLRHGDRVLWGNNHFFRVNCPKASNTSAAETPERPIDYEFAREELMMKELSNDPIQSAMKALERQHEEDKHNALEKQRQMYERQLQMLRNQMSPSTPYAPYSLAFDPLGLGKNTPTGLPSPSVQSKVERWAKERDELFKKSLAKLREDIVRANALVREANFLAEEMCKKTEFKVTLQIPAANLSPNRKRGAFVSEPAILVKRKNKGSQVWSMEKLENKLIDMRELYEERKEKGALKDEDSPKGLDPFYESQENHHLIGVANVFLEVLFHDVKLDYHVPIISQQGEAAGRLHVEIGRVSGSFHDRVGDASVDVNGDRDSIRGSTQDVSDDVDGISVGSHFVVRVAIKSATGLPPSLSNFVFCQYNFWGHPDPIVVPPVVNPDYPASRKGKDSMTFKFEHVKEFTVNVTEEFVEHCAEGALSIEVWGHRSAGFSTSKPGWEVDAQLQRSRSLADRWAELKRKIELWVEIHELNEQGDYTPVEVVQKQDTLTGGVYQLRQGQQRRVLVRVTPVMNSGTLPIICEAITSIAVGCVCARSKLQKPLDSYQEEDLTLLREKWSEALMRRREYLDEQIQKIINKQDKTDEDVEREQSLIDQWVCLTEERNAVLVPAPGSDIPGAPADWDPPPGMENHIPVIFLDLNADDMSIHSSSENGVQVAGANSILPKEHGSKLFNLPIVKYCEKDVCAIAAWDSSIHDSVHLNRVTPQNERVYLILKASVRLSHPATMDLILRKRLAINVYKKQSITERIKKRIGRQLDSVQGMLGNAVPFVFPGNLDYLYASGVTYEVVSNIPKASEDPEDRETLALMAASGEDSGTSDGESYIEKYTRGVSAVESILTLDRLRQEVAVKELLASQGRSLRKTASVPNIAHILRMEASPKKLEEQCRADSACDLSTLASYDTFDRYRQRSGSHKDVSRASFPVTLEKTVNGISNQGRGGNPFNLARPNFLNLNFNLNLSLRQATTPKSSISPQPTKLVKPMRTLLEEQSQREVQPLLDTDEATDEEQEYRNHSQNRLQDVVEEVDEEEFTEFESYLGKDNQRSKAAPATTELPEDQHQMNSQVRIEESQKECEMQHSATSESLVDLQTKAGTPSIISSGYGSQALSATPVSSEDSMSIQSICVDETPDLETRGSIIRESEETTEKGGETQILQPSEKELEQNRYNQEKSKLEDKDDDAQNFSPEIISGNTQVQAQTPAEDATEDKVEPVENKDDDDDGPEQGTSPSTKDEDFDDTSDVMHDSIAEEKEDGDDESVSASSLSTQDAPVPMRQNKAHQYAAHRASYPGHHRAAGLAPEQLDQRAQLSEMHLEKLGVSPSSSTHSMNGDSNEYVGLQRSTSEELDLDDSTSVSSFGSRADLHVVSDNPLPQWLTLGESVMINPYKKTGVVAFIGPTEFAPGTWVGVELDTPTGKNDGSVKGVRYFQCKPRFGIFVRPEKLGLDKRGRAVRAAKLTGHEGNLRRSSSKSEGLSTCGDNRIRRSRSRGEGLSLIGTRPSTTTNLYRSKSKGEGLCKVGVTSGNHSEFKIRHSQSKGEGLSSSSTDASVKSGRSSRGKK